LLDVREPDELEKGMIPGAMNLPLSGLRGRIAELDPARPLLVYCAVGLRGYIAQCFLQQHGFDVCNLNGGYKTWEMWRQSQLAGA
jgi:rhodanese-related sulfurtransferase